MSVETSMLESTFQHSRARHLCMRLKDLRVHVVSRTALYLACFKIGGIALLVLKKHKMYFLL